MRVGILGGGLTGLTVGKLLDGNGADVEVLEKESECGGLMRSLCDEGFTFDWGGSHIIFSRDKEALTYLLRALGTNKVRKKRNTKILYKGRFVKYPFENGLADLPIEDNLDCLRSFVENLINRKQVENRAPGHLREWFYSTFGRGITEKYLIPYNEKIWKHPLDDMSLDWVDRVPNPPLLDVMKSSLGVNTEGYAHQLYFYYPRIGGIQSVIKGFEAGISNKILRNHSVRAIRRKGNAWVVKDNSRERRYDKLISTIPIHNLVNALDVPGDIERAVRSLRFNSLITVMIGLDTSKLNEFSWLYIPDKKVMAHRVSFPTNFSPDVSPKHKSSALAEITCNYGDAVWRMDDNRVSDKVIDELDEVGLINSREVCFVGVRRLKHAYVINDLAYHKNMESVDSYFKGEGIDLIGRFSEFRYLNMDGCVRRAIDYAAMWRDSGP